MGILASLLWYNAERAFVVPYYEYKHLGPVCLNSVIRHVQAQVEYPRRISRDDRGIEHGKRIMVSVAKMEAGPAEMVHLAVKPVSGHVRFLSEDGYDTSGQLVLTATYGIANLGSLYLEHPNVSPEGTVSFNVQVLPPTAAITQPLPIQELSFTIEEESFVAGTIRRVAALIPWQTFLVTLLALPGALLKELWDRNRKMTDLYGDMQQAWEAWHIDDIRTLYHEYQRVRIRVSLFGRALDIPLSLKERLSEYGGFRTGRIKILDMVWGEDLLHGVIKARLQAASSPRSKVDSLKALTVGRRPETFMGGQRPRGWPMDLDSLLVKQAQGSPRRLITLVNMLFQHRAQIWHESGKRPTELYITMADWAILLEHRLGQGDVT